MIWEWAIAQEIWRRHCLKHGDSLDGFGYWQSRNHEVDFVTADDEWIEVKLGAVSPTEFGWLYKELPAKKLKVINQTRFNTGKIVGLTLEDFLLGG